MVSRGGEGGEEGVAPAGDFRLGVEAWGKGASFGGEGAEPEAEGVAEGGAPGGAGGLFADGAREVGGGGPEGEEAGAGGREKGVAKAGAGLQGRGEERKGVRFGDAAAQVRLEVLADFGGARGDIAREIEVEAVALDFGEGDGAGVVGDGEAGFPDVDDAAHVALAEAVLGAVLREAVLGVDQEDAGRLGGGGAGLVEHEDARGDAGAEEKVGREPDDAGDEAAAQEPAADLELGAAAEEDAVREDDGGAAGAGLHRGDDVEEEGVVAAAGGRHGRNAFAGAPAAEGVLRLAALEPVLGGEGRIGDDVVESAEPGVVDPVERIGEGVAVAQLGVIDAVDDHAHPRHADGGEVALLPVETRFARGFGTGAQEEGAGTAGGVVDGEDAGAGVVRDADEAGHHAAHFGRGVELALGLARLGGEVAHQVFIGVADQVVVRGAVAGEVQLRVLEDADELGDGLDEVLALAELVLVGEVGVVDDAVEGGVGLGDAIERDVDALADVRGVLEGDEVVEGTAGGQLEQEVRAGLGLVAEVFDEQDDEHVVLVLRGVHAAAQFVARLPEFGVELGFLDGHGRSPGERWGVRWGRRRRREGGRGRWRAARERPSPPRGRAWRGRRRRAARRWREAGREALRDCGAAGT